MTPIVFQVHKLRGALNAGRIVLLASICGLAAGVPLAGSGLEALRPLASSAHAAEAAQPPAGMADQAEKRGYLGVQIEPVTAEVAESLGLAAAAGALVAEPKAGDPAAMAGILAGDVITAVDGTAVKDARDLVRQIGGMMPGTAVKLTVWRKGAEMTIALTLGEMPKPHAARAITPDAGAERIEAPRLGLMLAPAGQVAGGGSEGLVVMRVDPAGLASEHGVKGGDVILEVGGNKVATPADVRNAMSDAKKAGKRNVLIRLKSDDAVKFVTIPIARA